ncbi:MAG: nucleotidyl transferase AbiEii/AbiGii toxin family protein [Candidatus Delongbacteria bacterium]|nr:nucleotidyl transferase AbiEii/AbiGii toxin family protein [Candidatus Delongbacteria bacterium]
MISKDTLNIGWIKQVSNENRKADKILIEKVIRALLLLDGLAESELPFIFKGGTAVMLLQGTTPKRFSTDIDIITLSDINFEDYFKKFLNEKNFTRYELQNRMVNSKIRKLHYKFYYTPVHQSNIPEDNILLDILIESNNYANLNPTDINSPFIKIDGSSNKVTIPGVEDLLGDKLTAFAPNTTGIPYEKNSIEMGMEIIKQLYDIGNLFEASKEMSTVSKTFRKIAETEMNYRNINAGVETVLNDIVQTSLCISTNNQLGSGRYDILVKGISKLKAYIFSEPFHIDKAIVFSSRAAYLSTLIEHKCTEIIKFKDPAQIEEWVIENQEINKLNKLKKSNPEAFFYWYQTYLLKGMIK